MERRRFFHTCLGINGMCQQNFCHSGAVRNDTPAAIGAIADNAKTANLDGGSTINAMTNVKNGYITHFVEAF